MPDDLDVLDVADRLWRVDMTIEQAHPFAPRGGIAEVADGCAFVPSFANVSAVSTDDGLVLVDTGSQLFAPAALNELRRWSTDRVHTAVYSHGHIDHVFGVPLIEEQASANGWAPPRVLAHEAMPARFDRYILTAGYNEVINRRQFGVPNLRWPTEYRYPDETYRDTLTVDVGGTAIELHHARGETDDHTWTWFAEQKLLCCGDFFIWACPNAGNPFKVQRYPKEWAVALREMAGMQPEILLPGHGVPIVGADRVGQALTDAAALLESLHDQTVDLMNEGASLDEVIHAVRGPAELLERPYLQPIYDDPEFIVRNVWRLYGGWWDGDPSHLKPAPETDLAVELAALAGGAPRLAERAVEIADAGDLRLAAHLAELAGRAAPDDRAVLDARAEVYRRRAAAERSLMARNTFNWAAGRDAP
ncbi:MAG: MBL fold metallo-hydrolase [Acidimicrobiia bacterium]|nr:MBL fold metallo-hydrolase [Acidimicrobiia bacterium]